MLNDDEVVHYLDDHYMDIDDHYKDMDDHQNPTVLCHRLNNSYHVIDVGMLPAARQHNHEMLLEMWLLLFISSVNNLSCYIRSMTQCCKYSLFCVSG